MTVFFIYITLDYVCIYSGMFTYITVVITYVYTAVCLHILL